MQRGTRNPRDLALVKFNDTVQIWLLIYLSGIVGLGMARGHNWAPTGLCSSRRHTHSRAGTFNVIRSGKVRLGTEPS